MTDNSVSAKSDQKQPRIAVVGDIMVDVDLHCTAERLCQEGPWPVLRVEKETRRMGGAGNVLEMLFALNAKAILLGIVGQDDYKSLPASGSMIGWSISAGRTTTKTRCWVNGNLTGPRLDIDNRTVATQQTVDAWERASRTWKPDAVIVADHGKGVVSREVMQMLMGIGIPVFVDPVQSTPSPRESYPAAIIGHDHEMPAWNWARCECVITKRGADGLQWVNNQQAGSMPSRCLTLVDPLGAGDQFIAALTYQRALGQSWERSIEWANVAAGMQCERAGCVPVTADEITQRTFQPRGSK